MTSSSRRWAYGAWWVLIGAFGALHALHLRADFPNHSPWIFDWAKYTDEGWYGNAAIRAHLYGRWYMPGDFNPAAAVPVWPFLEWVLFFFTGVTVQAARGLAVAIFFLNLLLSYLLLRTRGPRWMAMLALTLLATSPFLYCFSRLAILEPLLTACALGTLNLAVRLPKMRRPVTGAAWIGVLFTLMMLTKTTAVFLLPALGWAIVSPLWKDRVRALRCAAAAGGTFAVCFGAWMAMLPRLGLMTDYKYLFVVNKYVKPAEFYWPVLSLWWSLHGVLWADRILAPLAGLVVLGAMISLLARRAGWGRELLANPVAGASLLAIAGYLLFMTYQNHPQPRYYAIVAFFCFFLVAMGTEALLRQQDWQRHLGWIAAGAAVVAVAINAAWTLNFARHPEYTFVEAAERLTKYIDAHPNGKRLLVSISGDEITLVTHLPTICDDFGTQDLAGKLAAYQPGWYATWNEFDPGTLEDIHTHFSVEQVEGFRAFDDPERNVLVLFKLHPLPNVQVRAPEDQPLNVPLPGDRIDIPVE